MVIFGTCCSTTPATPFRHVIDSGIYIEPTPFSGNSYRTVVWTSPAINFFKGVKYRCSIRVGFPNNIAKQWYIAGHTVRILAATTDYNALPATWSGGLQSFGGWLIGNPDYLYYPYSAGISLPAGFTEIVSHTCNRLWPGAEAIWDYSMRGKWVQLAANLYFPFHRSELAAIVFDGVEYLVGPTLFQDIIMNPCVAADSTMALRFEAIGNLHQQGTIFLDMPESVNDIDLVNTEIRSSMLIDFAQII